MTDNNEAAARPRGEQEQHDGPVSVEAQPATVNTKADN